MTILQVAICQAILQGITALRRPNPLFWPCSKNFCRQEYQGRSRVGCILLVSGEEPGCIDWASIWKYWCPHQTSLVASHHFVREMECGGCVSMLTQPITQQQTLVIVAFSDCQSKTMFMFIQRPCCLSFREVLFHWQCQANNLAHFHPQSLWLNTLSFLEEQEEEVENVFTAPRQWQAGQEREMSCCFLSFLCDWLGGSGKGVCVKMG